MAKDYIPFPVGTVRGPYHNNGTCFMVQGTGGWIPFPQIKPESESECHKRALDYAKEMEDLSEATLSEINARYAALPAYATRRVS